ncbi:MAG: malto-oligosyltrehalose trehalohydrolase, partial [Micrococcaceae bacterium]|nr:malto-oligosyltrehalose trehalohydrolase [Micrococcaceae bacterium]
MSSTFDVWAPRAESLTLLVEGARHPMTLGEGGWWRPVEEPATSEDVSYGYLVDGSDSPVPDPRSRRQPKGVHKLSQTFDPAAHAWQDEGWQSPGLNGGFIYE